MVSPGHTAPGLRSPRLRGGALRYIRVSSQVTTGMFLALITGVLIAVLTSPGAEAAGGLANFRCLRPFSATGTFSSVAKAHPSQNCDFFYFTVEDAKAELKCASPSAATALQPESVSCNVTVRVAMRRASDVVVRLQQQIGTDKDYFTQEETTSTTRASPTHSDGRRPSAAPFLSDGEDVWRYAVSLRAKGDSSIHYKGFDGGNGYSLCCDALEEADCMWMAPQKGDTDLDCDEDVGVGLPLQQSRILRGCPLPFPAADSDAFGESRGARVLLTDLDEGDSSDIFHAAITKPLHRIVEGPWDMMVQMWRRRQQVPAKGSEDSFSVPVNHSSEADVLGRIMVPFVLNLTELQKQGRITHVPDMALTVESVEDVERVTSEKDVDTAEDL
ncbi:hypothetical protein, conserved [Leishmania tarentolae]|uniref:Uncharacterized protein n=1 Tax=Leishmania tarentolae TaxID=5689 RepID=A0A640KFA3_LEITA|nr:hypothetical protein, conserved [Leishmania tarentolae]